MTWESNDVAERLDYARTLFAGGYRYRSLRAVMVVVGALGVALGTFLFARMLPTQGPWKLFAHGFVALLCGVGGLMGFWALVDRKDAFSLTAAGIVEKGRMTAWQDVRKFAAEGQPDGRVVRLYFVAHGVTWRVHALHLSRPLTPREYELLKTMISQPGRLLTRGRLLRAVWGVAYGDEAHYLHVYVSRLRRKLDAADPTGQASGLIVAEPGVGYRISEPDNPT